MNNVKSGIKTEVYDFDYEGFECTVCKYEFEEIPSIPRFQSFWYCGYVIIPEGHEFYDKHYDQIDINCHGGLTYSGKFHIKESKNNEKYCIGFDMNHYDDNGGTKHDA